MYSSGKCLLNNAPQRSYQLWYQKDREDRATNHEFEKEHNEKTVISQAYTVVDERAVVVHLQHTSSAYLTMVTPRWLRTIALATLLHSRGGCLCKLDVILMLPLADS
jgi:hypothetical protein